MTDLCRCRCCHAEGNFRSLGESYATNGIDTIFCEMLRETFGVNIVPLSEEIGINTYSICSPCASRLKDASDFKRQVVACEKELLGAVKDAEFFEENMSTEINDVSNDAKGEYIFLEESEEEFLNSQEEKESKCTDEESYQRNRQPKKAKVKFPCNICPKSFKYQGALEVHMKKHTGESHPCQLCDAKFDKTKELSKHIDESHRENGKYICSICNSRFERVKIFKYHLKTHSGEIFRCDHCDKQYPRKKSLVEHLKLHSGVRNFLCKFCDKSFIHNQQLKYHMSSHTKEYKYTCALCGKQFPQQNNLKRHYILVHSGDKPLYSCSICKKQFSSKQYKIKHEKEHSGERPYSCDYCEKDFKDMTMLKSHLKVHTGERPYKCSYCDKRFAHIGTLTSHERIHTGERPFQCKVCAKAFVNSSRLKIHMRVHTGEKPYSCDVCDKSFAESGQLKRHKRGHTGEKFSCKYCDKQVSNVLRHTRAMHANE